MHEKQKLRGILRGRMSQENVEIVRAALDAINRGDLDAVLKATTPEFEFDFSRAVGPQHGVFRRDELLGVLNEFDEPWESVRREAEQFIEAGDQVRDASHEPPPGPRRD